MTGEKGARMREIKFRQPILVRGKFEYWHYWGFLSEGQFASPEINSSSINKAKETIQQFTGLHDRNGREIYEGDILLLANGISVPVYYDSGAFWAGAVLLLSEDKSSVVIGNKWENPELDPDQ